MEPTVLQNGTVVDRYTVDSLIGEGGMAVVFRVRHNTLETWHALKVLTLSSRQIRERLKQEGRFQARLQHPNIVAVTDVIDIGGSDGLIMEYVDGPSLDGLLRQQHLTLPQVDELAVGILAGVAEAHRLGFVHRDLKPGNVLLKITPRGYVPKVADFGLAKSFGEGSDAGKARTRTGSTMGTPHYMSPEQVRDAKNVGPRSDIFALGAILYEMITGRRAFEGEDLLEIFNAVASGQYTPVRELVPDLPVRMEIAIGAALQTDPQRRPESVEALTILWRGSNSPTLLSLSAPGFERPTSAFDMPGMAETSFSHTRGSETWAAAETLADAPSATDSVGGFPNPIVPALAVEGPGPTLAPATVARTGLGWMLGGGLAAFALLALLGLGVTTAVAWYWLQPAFEDAPPVRIADRGPPERPSPPEVPETPVVIVAGEDSPAPLPIAGEDRSSVISTDPATNEDTDLPPIPEVGAAQPEPAPAAVVRKAESHEEEELELIGMQASDDASDRRRAVENLGRRVDDEAIRLLGRFVQTDADLSIRRLAWTIVVERYLNRFGDVGLLETTIVWQASRGSARDATEAVEAFGRFGTDPRLLISAIRHDRREVRLAVVAVLPKVAARADEGIDYDRLMAPLLDDPDPGVQKKAKQARQQIR